MKLLALLLACAALHAHAATINTVPKEAKIEEPQVTNEVKKHVEQSDQIPVEVVAVPDKTETITKAESAPEKTEADPAVPVPEKTEANEVASALDDVTDEEPVVESADGLGALSMIKEAVENAQSSVQLSLDSFGQAFHSWVSDHNSIFPTPDQVKHVEQIFEKNLSNLKLNIKKYFDPLGLGGDDQKEVNVFSHDDDEEKPSAKQNEAQAPEVTGEASGANNTLSQGTISQIIQESFSNLTQNLQNFFQQGSTGNGSNNQWFQFGNFWQSTGAPDAQSDEVTSRPTIFQSIQNIFRPPQQNNQVQADQPVQPNRPLIQALQNNPIVQGLANLGGIRQTKPPAAPVTAKPQETSNVVPAPAKEGTGTEVKDKEKDKPTPGGPIQQAIQKNPIVQGIAGAVQRLQNTISKPDEPRTKFIGWHEHHGGHHGGHHDGQQGSAKYSDGSAATAGVEKGPIEPVTKEETDIATNTKTE